MWVMCGNSDGPPELVNLAQARSVSASATGISGALQGGWTVQAQFGTGTNGVILARCETAEEAARLIGRLREALEQGRPYLSLRET